jgi:toxin ParE1/3/4
MASVTRSHLARQDVSDIAFYIARENREASLRFLSLVDRTFRALAEQPEMGRDRSDLGRDVRSFPLEHYPYVIFYRRASDGVLIVRFLHGARDVDKLL